MESRKVVISVERNSVVARYFLAGKFATNGANIEIN